MTALSLCLIHLHDFPPSFLFLFFYGYADRFALHSFPTRRSSDLLLWPGQLCAVRATLRVEPNNLVVPREAVQSRSEEHTSELQSRRDLVCRLLLEKKNNVGDWYWASHRNESCQA